MELHAVDGQLDVPHTHDDPAFGARGDLEFRGHGVGQDRQRVIPRRGERIRKALQHTDIGVKHGAGLAVQQLRCPVDGAAERHPDRLVAEAHAEQRGLGRGAGPHQRDRGARALGGARSGAEQDTVEVRGRRCDVGIGG